MNINVEYACKLAQTKHISSWKDVQMGGKYDGFESSGPINTGYNS